MSELWNYEHELSEVIFGMILKTDWVRSVSFGIWYSCGSKVRWAFLWHEKNICFASLETGFWLTLNLFELWFWCFWAFLFQSYFGRKWSEKSHDTTISAIRKCIFWQGKEAESGSQSKFGGLRRPSLQQGKWTTKGKIV